MAEKENPMTIKFYDDTLTSDSHDLNDARDRARGIAIARSELKTREQEPYDCELVETIAGVGIWECKDTPDFGFSDESENFVMYEDGGTYPLEASTLDDAIAEAVESTRSAHLDDMIAEPTSATVWRDVNVGHPGVDSDDISSKTVKIDPVEPKCKCRHGHDWVQFSVVGNGGGVICHDRCSWCGVVMITDTWAQRPDTGEQGLRSVSYPNLDDYQADETIARRVGKRFDDDGQCWEIDDAGEDVVELRVVLDDIADGEENPADESQHRWEFEDGSAIVTTAQCWDYEGNAEFRLAGNE